MSTVLTRDQILGAEDRRVEFVLTPEWADSDPDAGVYVKSMTGTERDALEASMFSRKGNRSELNIRNLRARTLVLTIVDGPDLKVAKHIFSERDVDVLGRKSAEALQRVYAVAQRLSGLSVEDVEDLTNEVGEDQSGDSGTDSPAISDSPVRLLNEPSTVESSPSGESATASNP